MKAKRPKARPESITIDLPGIDLEAVVPGSLPTATDPATFTVALEGATIEAFDVRVFLDPDDDERSRGHIEGRVVEAMERRKQARDVGRRTGRNNGPRAGRPAKKREAAERWLRKHEEAVRKSRRSREGLATWALEEMPPRYRPGRTVMLAALARLFDTAR